VTKKVCGVGRVDVEWPAFYSRYYTANKTEYILI